MWWPATTTNRIERRQTSQIPALLKQSPALRKKTRPKPLKARDSIAKLGAVAEDDSPRRGLRLGLLLSGCVPMTQVAEDDSPRRGLRLFAIHLQYLQGALEVAEDDSPRRGFRLVDFRIHRPIPDGVAEDDSPPRGLRQVDRVHFRNIDDSYFDDSPMRGFPAACSSRFCANILPGPGEKGRRCGAPERVLFQRACCGARLRVLARLRPDLRVEFKIMTKVLAVPWSRAGAKDA